MCSTSCRTVSTGPSPRAWGADDLVSGRETGVRSIPTCVGFTGTTRTLNEETSVHPHVRGVHVARAA
ncbi:hypothetical protein B005_2175 [Nocardiopsis alba ATCC BAA-2165]|uniref:Uncharacterized protein n=1 Tax=Nocardiopsis alba (strain ATCC BAA-2165 / BE74) TaxID=1205910 RepID=J7L5I4_NOCAA|nr:hypothetical protein B005_2175 [Nocardiopsis alba ATCC BAA-2165]